MDKTLTAFGALALRVYNAESVRVLVLALNPNNNSGATQ